MKYKYCAFSSSIMLKRLTNHAILTCAWKSYHHFSKNKICIQHLCSNDNKSGVFISEKKNQNGYVQIDVMIQRQDRIVAFSVNLVQYYCLISVCLISCRQSSGDAQKLLTFDLNTINGNSLVQGEPGITVEKTMTSTGPGQMTIGQAMTMQGGGSATEEMKNGGQVGRSELQWNNTGFIET